MGLSVLDPPTRIILLLITVVAITFHYGNVPLAVALFSIAAVLEPKHRRTIVKTGIVAGCIVLAAASLNFMIGVVGFGTASVAPKRAAIVLARSIEDGPARWVLEEDCASAEPRYALCEYWGADIPTNVGAALWSENGMEQAPPELNARIREEEVARLTEAFLSYPGAQTWALMENAWRQFFLVGARYTRPGDLVEARGGRIQLVVAQDTVFENIRDELGSVQSTLYIASLAGLFLLRGYRGVAVVLFAGLAINAAIFGGFSAPVPRYQARVAWVAFAVVVVLLADHYLRSQSMSRHYQNE